MAKTYTFDVALTLLHNGFWWEFTDWNNRTYANLRVRDGFDYTLPTEEELNSQVTQLQAEYDAQDYARKRQREYPKIEDLVVALYDTEDKTAIDAKRAEIKLKYPKPEA